MCRRPALADPAGQQRLRLQDQHRQRHPLQHGRPPVPLHRQRHIREVGRPYLGWTHAVGYIDADYNIFDGAHVEENCTDINKAPFLYTAAIFIQGLGFMHNYVRPPPTLGVLVVLADSRRQTAKEPWPTHLEGLINRTIAVFFPDGVATEVARELEHVNQCTADMLSLKGYVHRFMAQTVQMAPFMHDTIMPALRWSAAGMTKGCNPDGTCGFRWNRDKYDGETGAGQQMNALGALMSLLIDDVTTPTRAATRRSTWSPTGPSLRPTAPAPAS